MTATHRWFQVRSRYHCSLGVHEVYGGTWMRMRNGDVRQLASCEACLAEAGIGRPIASVSDMAQAEVKLRSAK